MNLLCCKNLKSCLQECLYLLEGSYFEDARFGVITMLLKAHYLGCDAVTE
jgi:hypothetical protein